MKKRKLAARNGRDSEPGLITREAIAPLVKFIDPCAEPALFIHQYKEAKSKSPFACIVAVHWCTREVYNGGIHQFFFNHEGVLAPEAVQGFDTIGMPKAAKLLRFAMAFFGRTYPRNLKVRRARLNAIPDAIAGFGALDDKFHDLLGLESNGVMLLKLHSATDAYVLNFKESKQHQMAIPPTKGKHHP